MSEDAQRQAQLAQYNDELARKRQQSEHELQRQRNQEMVAMQEQAAARKEAERLRIEQQIQAERRAADQHAVRLEHTSEVSCRALGLCLAAYCSELMCSNACNKWLSEYSRTQVQTASLSSPITPHEARASSGVNKQPCALQAPP